MMRFSVLLAIVVATPALAEPVGVPLKDSVPHMTTTGEASVDVVPDQADLTLAIEQERPSADEAAEATAKAAVAVIDAVKAHGVASADIQTRFSIAETFLETKNEHGIVTSRAHRGYKAREEISVRLYDTAKVGVLGRELIGKGTNLFEGVFFSFSKEKTRRRELQGAAIRDAYQEARTYTDSVGLKLGRVLQIGEDPFEPDGQADMPSRRAPPLYGVATPIPTEPGVQHLRATVRVVWEIEGTAR